MASFHFLGGFQAFSSEVGETTLSASLSTLTTDDGLGCEEEVIDTKAYIVWLTNGLKYIADNLMHMNIAGM